MCARCRFVCRVVAYEAFKLNKIFITLRYERGVAWHGVGVCNTHFHITQTRGERKREIKGKHRNLMEKSRKRETFVLSSFTIIALCFYFSGAGCFRLKFSERIARQDFRIPSKENKNKNFIRRRFGGDGGLEDKVFFREFRGDHYDGLSHAFVVDRDAF